MANDLFDKDKKIDAPSQDASQPSPSAESSTTPDAGLNINTIGAYGRNNGLVSGAYLKELEQKKKEEEGVPWTDDRRKRMAIRVFSRGVLGAAFFTTGGLLAKRWMMPGKYIWKDKERAGYNASNNLFEQENGLQFIAKLIDTVVGKPIEMVFGKSATRFRPTVYPLKGSPDKTLGRSLGFETVMITFDFFCASIGDAWGRDIAGWFDPNVKKEWLVEDEKGHKHIEFPKAIHSALGSLTRYVTYNGGEDWAVAIPYVYFMKGQRALLNKFKPGFAYDFDQQLNGASFITKHNPATNRHEIVDDFNKVGMFDLHTRFAVYNVGTLMFRELYDHFKHVFHGRPDHLYGAADRPPSEKGILGTAAYLLKWVGRSTIKGMIYMTPAVPFFWITRTPQTKHRGMFIDPEHGALTRFSDATRSDRQPVYANDIRDGKIRIDEPFFHSGLNKAGEWERDKLSGSSIQAVRQRHNFDPYGQGKKGVPVMIDAIGKFNYGAAGSLDDLAGSADKHLPLRDKIRSGLDIKNFERFTRPTVYASISYTPYMIAKAETALLWDSGKMDMAAERMLDGAFKLNWGEFKAGAGEVWRTFLFKPLADPAREAEGERRLLLDRAPTDVFTQTGAQMKKDKEKASERRWQDFVVGKKPEEKSTRPAAAGADITKRGNYKDEEEKLKVLRDTDPPSNSVH